MDETVNDRDRSRGQIPGSSMMGVSEADLEASRRTPPARDLSGSVQRAHDVSVGGERSASAQLRGGERYAGSRAPAPRSRAPRGVER